MNNQVRIYHIDLTVTDQCNFRCTYCFEHDCFNQNNFTDIDKFCNFIDNLLTTDFFKSNYSLLSIGFWGGEPTLNSKTINAVEERYRDNDLVKFMCYSNGYDITSILPALERHKHKRIHGHPKFFQQISYDGEAIHSKTRLHKSGSITADQVKKTILLLDDADIPHSIKSTIQAKDFSYLYEAYLDIREISDRKLNKTNNIWRNNSYFPTIEYYAIDELSKDEVEEYSRILNKELIKISKHEIEYVRHNKRFFFSWFNDGKATCSAGRDMICVNFDGDIYKCHDSYYDEDTRKDHLISNIDDESIENKLIESQKLHSGIGIIPKECTDCIATYCLKCNSMKYRSSKEPIYIDRWTDYPSQPNLCHFFKLNGKFVRALKSLI